MFPACIPELSIDPMGPREEALGRDGVKNRAFLRTYQDGYSVQFKG